MPGILSLGELQALTVQMGTPPLQTAEMIHTSRYLYNICNFSKCQLEYIKNTKVFSAPVGREEEGQGGDGGRGGWRRKGGWRRAGDEGGRGMEESGDGGRRGMEEGGDGGGQGMKEGGFVF